MTGPGVVGIALMTLGTVLLGRVIVLNVSQVWAPRWYERQLLLVPVAVLLVTAGAALAAD